MIAELVETLPAEDTGEAPVRHRKLAIAGFGASGGKRGRAADADDPDHGACDELLDTDPGPLVTTALVIAEAGFLIDRQVGRSRSSARR